MSFKFTHPDPVRHEVGTFWFGLRDSLVRLYAIVLKL